MSRYKPYPGHKDSRVEWIEQIPEHWETKPIKRIVTCNDDSLDEQFDPTSTIKYVDISSVSLTEGIGRSEKILFSDAPSRARRKAKEGDVVISTVRTYLKAVAQVSEQHADCVFSTGFAVLRAKKQFVYPPFLKWFSLNELLIQSIECNSKGLSYPAINASELVDLPSVLPSEEEQKIIAEVLDKETNRIDALIAKKTRFVELLKEKRQALITHAVTKGLDPNVKMKDSGVQWIGEVPEHWTVKSMGYAFDSIGDVDHFMPDSVESGVPYLMTGDLDELASQVNMSTCKQVTQEDYEKLSKKIKTGPGDVVVARYATIGTSMYVDIDTEFLVSYSCVTIKTKRSDLSGLYLFLYLKSHAFYEGISDQVNTGTQGNVGIGDLKKVKMVLPPLSEQDEIITFLRKNLSKIDALSNASHRSVALLKERRSAFITAAVTGQIDLRSEVDQ